MKNEKNVTTEFKKKQILYYRQKWTNGGGLPKSKVVCFFSTIGLERIVEQSPLELKQKKVLITCGGGDGFEVKKMESLMTDLTVTDISPESLKKIKLKFPNCKLIVADAEKLPFRNNSFDIGLVKDGLHHLIDPEEGIKELYRVSREAVFIIDFQESFITKLFKFIGISPEFEEAGNFNYRFRRKDLERLLKEMKVKKYKIKSILLDARPFRNGIFETRPGFFLMKSIFYFTNLLFSRWGNVLLLVILKNKKVRSNRPVEVEI